MYQVTAVFKAVDQVSGTATAISRSIAGVEGTVKSVGAGIASAGKALTMGLTVPLVAMGTMAVKTAATFEQSMRNVNAIAQLPEDQFKSLTDQIVDFSLTTRASSTDVANGLYNVVSAGMSLDEALASVTFEGKKMSEGMAVMQASSRAAGAGMATVEEMSRLLIASMRAYGMSADEAGRITDIFLHTVNKGLTTLPELASSLGRVIPTAANLGSSLEEVGFSLARMTQTGLSTEEAVTRLNQVMMSFIKPSEALQGALSQLGYTSGTELVEAAGGLLGALRVLRDSGFLNTNEAISELFPNLRAIGGVMALMADETTLAKGAVEEFAQASEGAVERARVQQYASLETQLKKLTGALEVLAIEAGNVLLPALTDIASAVTGFVREIGKADPATIELAVKIGAIAAAAGPVLIIVGQLISAIGTIGGVISGAIYLIGGLGGALETMALTIMVAADGFMALLGPIGLVVLALGGLVALFIAVKQHQEAMLDASAEATTAAQNYGEYRQALDEAGAASFALQKETFALVKAKQALLAVEDAAAQQELARAYQDSEAAIKKLVGRANEMTRELNQSVQMQERYQQMLDAGKISQEAYDQAMANSVQSMDKLVGTELKALIATDDLAASIIAESDLLENLAKKMGFADEQSLAYIESIKELAQSKLDMAHATEMATYVQDEFMDKILDTARNTYDLATALFSGKEAATAMAGPVGLAADVVAELAAETGMSADEIQRLNQAFGMGAEAIADYAAAMQENADSIGQAFGAVAENLTTYHDDVAEETERHYKALEKIEDDYQKSSNRRWEDYQDDLTELNADANREIVELQEKLQGDLTDNQRGKIEERIEKIREGLGLELSETEDHYSKMAGRYAADKNAAVTAEQEKHKGVLAAMEAGYEEELKAQQKHLAQLLTDRAGYMVATGEITKDQYRTLQAALAEHFGIQVDETKVATSKLLDLYDDWAKGGATSAEDLVNNIENIEDKQAEWTQQAKEDTASVLLAYTESGKKITDILEQTGDEYVIAGGKALEYFEGQGEAAAGAAFIVGDAASQMQDALTSIPEEVVTEVKVEGVAEAEEQAQDLTFSLLNVPATVLTTILAQAEDAIQDAEDAAAAMNAIPRSVHITVTATLDLPPGVELQSPHTLLEYALQNLVEYVDENFPIDIGVKGADGIVPVIGEVENAVDQLGQALVEASEDLDDLLGMASDLSSIGGFFAGLFEEQRLDPITSRLEEVNRIIGLLEAVENRSIGQQMSLNKLYKERRDLSAEYAEQEEKVLALQKAQQDLQFLEQQAKLLDLITEHGLDASEILAGVKLGLGADVGEMTEAMTRAMQAIIAAAEDELQIGSPSKRFMELMQHAMEGAAIGAERYASLPAQAVEGALADMSGLFAMPAPRALFGGVVKPAVGADGGKTEIHNHYEMGGYHAYSREEPGEREAARVLRELEILTRQRS